MENNQKLHDIRHSLAHFLAMAVLKHDPDAKLAIGPVIDNGFYYDFQLTRPISDSDLPALEAEMRKLISAKLDFVGKEISKDEALQMFAHQPFKKELVEDLVKEGHKLTAYTTGHFTDLCRGGHVKNASEIPADAFKLDKIAGAYWRGDEKNPQLTRIYGLAFSSKHELDEYIKMQEEAEKRDHRKLGKELGLFIFSDVVGKGLPIWTDKGATVRRVLERFIVDEEIRRGYLHVITPDIANLELYKKSGHYPYYKDSMYAPIKIDDEEYMLRPMSCPHHFELYLSKPRSYKELPMRIAEIVKLYRYEQSGELTGLIRVRSFSLADAHIVCTGPEQAASEVNGALDLIEYVASTFGLEMGKDYSYRLSLGDRTDGGKYYKDDQAWDVAEGYLREVLKKRGATFVEAPGEAAFYGPKIDVQMKNVRGKEDTAFTVQYDFVMPKRLNLTYKDADGQEKQAVVVHRSSIGAIERIMAFLIERFAGAFPLWLAPVQVTILPVSEKFKDYAMQVAGRLKAEDVRVEIDSDSETLGKRIRNAKLMKVPYILVIGQQEADAGTVTAESRDNGQMKDLKLDSFVGHLKLEIKNRK